MSHSTDVTEAHLDDQTRPPTRLDRRKAHTRAALIGAAQAFMAEGRTNVPVHEITEAADLGTGSFYNHFESKEQLFEAALADALERLDVLLDSLTAGVEDPALVFVQSFRLIGRMHRLEPELSKALLNNGLAAAGAPAGLAARGRRDIQAAVDRGRFKVANLDAVMMLVFGAVLCLGQLLHDRPEIDDAAMTDQVGEELLKLLGMSAKQASKICAQALPDFG